MGVIDWFEQHVNPYRAILVLKVKELRFLSVHIYIFV